MNNVKIGYLKNINVNVIFKINNSDINIQTNKDCLFADVAYQFLQKIGGNDKNFQFFFNGRELCLTSGKTLEELGIKNFSSIDVFEAYFTK